MASGTSVTVVDASHLGIQYTVWLTPPSGGFDKHYNVRSFGDLPDAVYNVSEEADVSSALCHDFCPPMSQCQVVSA